MKLVWYMYMYIHFFFNICAWSRKETNSLAVQNVQKYICYDNLKILIIQTTCTCMCLSIRLMWQVVLLHFYMMLLNHMVLNAVLILILSCLATHFFFNNATAKTAIYKFKYTNTCWFLFSLSFFLLDNVIYFKYLKFHWHFC